LISNALFLTSKSPNTRQILLSLLLDVPLWVAVQPLKLCHTYDLIFSSIPFHQDASHRLEPGAEPPPS